MSTETTCLSILKFILCLLLITSIEAYKEIKAYRLIQYETENNVYGSQYSSLNYIGSHYKGDVGRKISLIKFIDFGSLEDIKEFISSQATAFLIILPKKIDINESMQNLLISLQKYFSEQNYLFPVYFTTETSDINDVYMELKAANGFKETEEEIKGGLFGIFEMEGNLLQFSLNSSDPKKVESLTFENFYGFLEGNKGESGTGSNPVIAIVGSYDDLSIVPDMPTGLNETSASIIAIYEIIRIVSKFYENYNSFASYDILFLLTSGGEFKNQGLNSFINSLDSATVDNIHFALCLESLSTSNLQLLINKFPEVTEETPFKFQKALNSTSSSMSVELEYTQSAVLLEEDVNAQRNPHDLFTKKNIPSATLTKRHITVSENAFSKKPLISNLDKNSLKQAIKLVSETLIAFIFEIENISIFKDDETVIDDNNLNYLITFFEKYPRTPLNILKDSTVNNEIFGLLKNYLSKLQRQVFEYKDIKFYDSASGTIKIYSVKSKMIDLYILFVVVIYLLGLYILIKGPKQFYQSIKAAFTEG